MGNSRKIKSQALIPLANPVSRGAVPLIADGSGSRHTGSQAICLPCYAGLLLRVLMRVPGFCPGSAGGASTVIYPIGRTLWTMESRAAAVGRQAAGQVRQLTGGGGAGAREMALYKPPSPPPAFFFSLLQIIDSIPRNSNSIELVINFWSSDVVGGKWKWNEGREGTGKGKGDKSSAE